jgi:hypothetical protein
MTINKPHSVLQLGKKRQIWYNSLKPKEQAFTGIADKYANSLKKKSLDNLNIFEIEIWW